MAEAKHSDARHLRILEHNQAMGNSSCEQARQLRRQELVEVVANWGFSRGTGCKRMVALWMALGRGLRGRFSELALLQCRDILFLPEGVLFLTSCNNRTRAQYGNYVWVPLADSGAAQSTVALLRLYLTDLGFEVPEPTAQGAQLRAGTADLETFLLRSLMRCSQAQTAEYSLGDGRLSMQLSIELPRFLAQLRQALRQCCGYSATVAAEFGMCSMRSGGLAALLESGTQMRGGLVGEFGWSTTKQMARRHMALAQAYTV